VVWHSLKNYEHKVLVPKNALEKNRWRVEMFWVLFFITDNQEFQHGSPGILGFIFYNGQSRNP